MIMDTLFCCENCNRLRDDLKNREKTINILKKKIVSSEPLFIGYKEKQKECEAHTKVMQEMRQLITKLDKNVSQREMQLKDALPKLNSLLIAQQQLQTLINSKNDELNKCKEKLEIVQTLVKQLQTALKEKEKEFEQQKTLIKQMKLKEAKTKANIIKDNDIECSKVIVSSVLKLALHFAQTLEQHGLIQPKSTNKLNKMFKNPKSILEVLKANFNGSAKDLQEIFNIINVDKSNSINDDSFEEDEDGLLLQELLTTSDGGKENPKSPEKSKKSLQKTDVILMKFPRITTPLKTVRSSPIKELQKKTAAKHSPFKKEAPKLSPRKTLRNHVAEMNDHDCTANSFKQENEDFKHFGEGFQENKQKNNICGNLSRTFLNDNRMSEEMDCIIVQHNLHNKNQTVNSKINEIFKAMILKERPLSPLPQEPKENLESRLPKIMENNRSNKSEIISNQCDQFSSSSSTRRLVTKNTTSDIAALSEKKTTDISSASIDSKLDNDNKIDCNSEKTAAGFLNASSSQEISLPPSSKDDMLKLKDSVSNLKHNEEINSESRKKSETLMEFEITKSAINNEYSSLKLLEKPDVKIEEVGMGGTLDTSKDVKINLVAIKQIEREDYNLTNLCFECLSTNESSVENKANCDKDYNDDVAKKFSLDDILPHVVNLLDEMCATVSVTQALISHIEKQQKNLILPVNETNTADTLRKQNIILSSLDSVSILTTAETDVAKEAKYICETSVNSFNVLDDVCRSPNVDLGNTDDFLLYSPNELVIDLPESPTIAELDNDNESPESPIVAPPPRDKRKIESPESPESPNPIMTDEIDSPESPKIIPLSPVQPSLSPPVAPSYPFPTITRYWTRSCKFKNQDKSLSSNSVRIDVSENPNRTWGCKTFTANENQKISPNDSNHNNLNSPPVIPISPLPATPKKSADTKHAVNCSESFNGAAELTKNIKLTARRRISLVKTSEKNVSVKPNSKAKSTIKNDNTSTDTATPQTSAIKRKSEENGITNNNKLRKEMITNGESDHAMCTRSSARIKNQSKIKNDEDLLTIQENTKKKNSNTRNGKSKNKGRRSKFKKILNIEISAAEKRPLPLPMHLMLMIKTIINELKECGIDLTEQICDTTRDRNIEISTSKEQILLEKVIEKTKHINPVAKKRVFDTLKQSLNTAIFTDSSVQTLGRASLCRFYCSICKYFDKLEETKELSYNLLIKNMTDVAGYFIINILDSLPASGQFYETLQYVLVNYDIGLMPSMKSYITSLFTQFDYRDSDSFVLNLLLKLREPNEEVNEISWSIEILASVKGWLWTENFLIRNHLWPTIKSYETEVKSRKKNGGVFQDNDLFEKYAANVFKIFGLVCRKCPASENAVVIVFLKELRLIMRTVNLNLVSPFAQEALMEAIIRLEKFRPDITRTTLQFWLTSTKHTVSPCLQTLIDQFAKKMNVEVAELVENCT